MRRALLVLFLITVAFADEARVGDHNVGLAAGFTTGYGLSYRQWTKSGYGFQVTGVPYYSKSGDTIDALFSLGCAGLKKVKEMNLINLFGYLAAHLQYAYKNNVPNYSINPYIPSTLGPEKICTFFTGGGFGLDFHFWVLSFNAMSGIRYWTDFKAQSSIGMTAETALYYSF